MKEIDDILDEMRKHACSKQLPHYRRLITGFVYRLEPLIRQLEADRDNWRRQALDEDARANAINSAANTNVDAKVYSMRDMAEAVVKAATQAVQLTNEKFAKRFSKVGNAAAMFNALKQIDRIVWDKCRHTKEEVEAHRLATEALSAPPRNCDLYATLDDARNAFFVDYVPDETCTSATAFAIWLFAEAKGESK